MRIQAPTERRINFRSGLRGEVLLRWGEVPGKIRELNRTERTDRLEELFRLGRETLERLREIQTLGRIPSPGFVKGRLVGAAPEAFLREIEADHPVYMQRPFEDCDTVAGGVWPAADSGADSGSEGIPAVLKLRFDPGADDLPIHVHEHSDRVLLAVEGRGWFHVTPEPFDRFTGTGMEKIEAGPGDIVTFRRGLPHTFSASTEGLTLLSYHSPFIGLEDPRQYRLPERRWTPGRGLETGSPI